MNLYMLDELPIIGCMADDGQLIKTDMKLIADIY